MPQTTSKSETGKPRRVDGSQDRKFILKLFVTGMTQNSVLAVENLRKICENHLKDNYELQIIDIYQQPELARDEQIVAAPTLVKKLPPPLRKVIGGLSDTKKVLVGLDITEEKTRK